MIFDANGTELQIESVIYSYIKAIALKQNVNVEEVYISVEISKEIYLKAAAALDTAYIDLYEINAVKINT